MHGPNPCCDDVSVALSRCVTAYAGPAVCALHHTLRNCYPSRMTPVGDPEHDAWPTTTLNERFKAIDKDLTSLEHQIRALAPVVSDMAVMQVTATTMRKDLDELEGTVKTYVNRSVTKQLIIATTPLFLTSLGLLLALFLGKL